MSKDRKTSIGNASKVTLLTGGRLKSPTQSPTTLRRNFILVLAAFVISTTAVAAPPKKFPKFGHVARVVEVAADTVTAHPEPEFPAAPDSTFTDPAVEWAYSLSTPRMSYPRVFTGYRDLSPELFNIPDGEAMMAWATEPKIAWDIPSPLSPNLRAAFRRMQIDDKLLYYYMTDHPRQIEYASWDFPKPPMLPDIDKRYNQLFRKFEFPPLTSGSKIEAESLGRRNWLHYFNVGLQFSQAYVSSNWYQGGNNYLALLFNFTWNVDLNTVYHPNLLLQSSLTYRLAINSNPKGSLHKYSLTQDNFQYNLKMGLKAFNYWFYSFTLQMKTPFFNTYPENSDNRTGAFLSPGNFNLGLGMTFNKQNKKKTWKLSASIAPISYNLKTCVAHDVDHAQYGIEAHRKTASEIGSNLEANMTWNISDNVSWVSRMFLFTDYKYFQADWENTFNFVINKFLSTQLYVHPRFDSSSDFNSSKWHYWMLKEILSIGLSYTFSTKG